MQVRQLRVPDAHEFVPPVFPDDRGVFVAPFQEPAFVDAVGHRLSVAQANTSVSARHVLRGLHFADTPPGQAKYVQCAAGSVLDVVLDLRVGSPTFGAWDSVVLTAEKMNAVYVAEGLGHGFLALTEGAVVSYLCSVGYRPAAEHGVHPLDPALGLPWPADVEPQLSAKDRAAPTLAEAERTGLLPRYADCMAHYAALRAAP